MSASTKPTAQSAPTAVPCDLLHDLRTPLNHILGYSELLMEQMSAAGHEEYVPHLEKIRKAGHDLLDLMNNHLTTEAE
jgi:signal transduction histidine kinase